MNTNKRSAAVLAIVVIFTAIALVTAGSLTTSTLAVKSHKASTSSHKKATTTSVSKSTSDKTKSGTSSLSKFFSCVRAAGKLTRSSIDSCYGTTSSSSSSVLIPLATP